MQWEAQARCKWNRAAMSYEANDIMPLPKVTAEKGHPLPAHPAGAMDHHNDRPDLAVGAIPGSCPLDRTQLYEMTHDEINAMAIDYNDHMGIVAGDNITRRRQKVHAFVLGRGPFLPLQGPLPPPE